MNRTYAWVVKMITVVALAMTWSTAQAVTDDEKAAIAERIKLAGDVCVEGDEACAAAAAPVAATTGGAKSGEEVYNASCMACHATGAAGAPKKGDAAAWSARIDQGMEVLFNHAINGFKGMPAKGTCMSCSDDEVKAAVTYMVDASK